MIAIAGIGLNKPCMHAGGDDRQPPCGAVLFVIFISSAAKFRRFSPNSTFDSTRISLPLIPTRGSAPGSPLGPPSHPCYIGSHSALAMESEPCQGGPALLRPALSAVLASRFPWTPRAVDGLAPMHNRSFCSPEIARYCIVSLSRKTVQISGEILSHRNCWNIMPYKSQIPLRYLVRSWLATGFEPASNLLRTSFEPDSVMEFDREPASSC